MSETVTREQYNLRMQCFIEHLTDEEAAKRLGITRCEFKSWRRDNNLYHYHKGESHRGFGGAKPKINDEMVERMIDLRCEGKTFKQIAEAVGISDATARRAIIERGYR